MEPGIQEDPVTLSVMRSGNAIPQTSDPTAAAYHPERITLLTGPRKEPLTAGPLIVTGPVTYAREAPINTIG